MPSMYDVSLHESVGSMALRFNSFKWIPAKFISCQVSGHHATLKSTFGWTRIEVVAALMNGTFLLAICFSIFIEATQRFIVGAESNELAQGAEDLLIVGQTLIQILIWYIYCYWFPQWAAIIGLVMNLIGLVVFGEKIFICSQTCSCLIASTGHGHTHNEEKGNHETAETCELESVNVPLEKADETQRYDIVAKVLHNVYKVCKQSSLI